MARTALNSGDIAALRTFVQSDGATAAWRAAGDDGSIAAYLNTASTTDAWRVAVQPQEIDEATNWANFDNITQDGKRDSFGYMLRYARDFSRNKVRKWIADVWGDNADAASILQAGIEKASLAQNALGGTSRTTGTAGNAVTGLDRNYVGQVQGNEVALMRGAGW
jgi:hypothetical protein